MQASAVAQANTVLLAAQQQIAARLSTSQVSAAVLARATGDGDGRTGAAALNDGDAAAAAARQSVQSGSRVDIRV
jgi:hypothetical protein